MNCIKGLFQIDQDSKNKFALIKQILNVFGDAYNSVISRKNTSEAELFRKNKILLTRYEQIPE